MSAGKSPNNAFNLHKQRMLDVFSDIQLDQKSNLTTDSPLFTNARERALATSYFYWEYNPYQNRRLLYSKGYVNIRGEVNGDKMCGIMSPSKNGSLDSIKKVREYYTDGVRPIGAME